MNTFKLHSTTIASTGHVIAPDMIEVEITKELLDAAFTSLVKMSGAPSFNTLEVEINYKLYQRTDHLEPADYADLEVITGDDGVLYVERDLNYTIDSVKVRMSGTGDIAAHFGVAGSNDNILCAIGTYNGLVLGLKPWNEIYITDKSGKHYFRTTACLSGTMPEVRNLQRKIPHCAFLDKETVKIMLNGQEFKLAKIVEPAENEMSDDELLAELQS